LRYALLPPPSDNLHDGYKVKRRKEMNVLKRAMRRWAELGTRELVHEDGTRERRPVIIRSSRV
jgi:hypothetical protein